ncbi:hypothetical protein [Stakelama pacifica]|nr:hypothetical protein [Stakelama pacifica]
MKRLLCEASDFLTEKMGRGWGGFAFVYERGGDQRAQPDER